MRFCCPSHRWQAPAVTWLPWSARQVCVWWYLPKTPFSSRGRCNGLWAPHIHRQMETLIFPPPPLSLFSQAELFILPQGTYVLLQGGSAKSRTRANSKIWHISQGSFYCPVGPSVLMDSVGFNGHVTQGPLWPLFCWPPSICRQSPTSQTEEL